MKIINLEPNTPEWEAFRRLKIGASDCPAICGVDPYTKPEKLWKRKFTGDKQYVSPAMRRGSELEGLARQMLEKSRGCAFPPMVVQHDRYDWMIASLDGYNEGWKCGVEIKCPGEKVFNKIVIERDIPKNYIYQVQHQMCVTDNEEYVLLVFNGVYFEEFSIYRDEGIIEELIAKEERFYESLIRGEYCE